MSLFLPPRRNQIMKQHMTQAIQSWNPGHQTTIVTTVIDTFIIILIVFPSSTYQFIHPPANTSITPQSSTIITYFIIFLLSYYYLRSALKALLHSFPLFLPDSTFQLSLPDITHNDPSMKITQWSLSYDF